VIYRLAICVALILGCTRSRPSPAVKMADPGNVSVRPLSNSTGFLDNRPVCEQSPAFQFLVLPERYISVEASAVLDVNGEQIPVSTASPNAPWGSYFYSGPVPYDGDLRFRFEFHYVVRPVASLAGGPGDNRVVYQPENAYVVTPYGWLTWTATAFRALNGFDTRGPTRVMVVRETVRSADVTGALSKTETLTIRNSSGMTLRINSLSVFDRATGGAVSDIVVSVASGAQLPRLLGRNQSVAFTVTYSVTPAGAETSFSRTVGLTFSLSDDAAFGTCSFGPIWIDGSFVIDPE
jgi:hypothetical protein